MSRELKELRNAQSGLFFSHLADEDSTSNNERQLRTRLPKADQNKSKKVKRTKEKSSSSNTPIASPITENEPSTSLKMGTDPSAIAADPHLKGLSPTKLDYISKLLMQQSVAVATSMRVVPLNPSINIPIYNENTMTSDTFFTQCELYLTSQGFQAVRFHEVIRIILAGDPSKKLWYDHVSNAIGSWADFKTKFKAKYDSPLVQERRKDMLRRKQRYDEPVEKYVYEIVNLSKQITPGEDEAISVLRAKLGLVADLSLYIGDCKTVDDLLEKTSIAIEKIKESDRRNGRHTRLPPFSIGEQVYNNTVF